MHDILAVAALAHKPPPIPDGTVAEHFFQEGWKQAIQAAVDLLASTDEEKYAAAATIWNGQINANRGFSASTSNPTQAPITVHKKNTTP